MQKSADIIIIGAGITGCAIFHELSTQRLGHIILIDSGKVASGTTGQSGGLIRKMFQDPATEKFAAESVDYYLNFEEKTGFSCGFIKIGCQYRLGDNNELVYEADAGCINPILACENWIKSANHQDSILMSNTTVNKILIKNDHVEGIETSQGKIICQHIIIAAGGWSCELLQQNNINLGLQQKLFRYHYYSQQKNTLQSAVINLRDQYYLIPTRHSTIIAGSLTDDDRNEYLELAANTYMSSHTAQDAFCSSQPGLIGQAPNINGLYLATGWSGGGIKIAPAVARYIAKSLLIA